MNRTLLFVVLSAAIFAAIEAQTVSNNTICVDSFFNSAPFTGPTVQIHDPNDGSGNLFALYQDGRFVSFNRTTGAPTTGPNLVLNAAAGAENGAYSFLLHPQFATNRRAFFWYTCNSTSDAQCYAFCQDDDWCNGGTCVEGKCSSGAASELLVDVLEEWNVPATGAASAVRKLTTVPFVNIIQGGGLYIDGSTLYLGTGDGSAANDTYLNSQNLNRTAGKLLAFNIDAVEIDPLPGRNATPAANGPFVAVSKFPEIFALGLRQPYKIIKENGVVAISDIGESRAEEINELKRGANYGWPSYEGETPYLTNVPVTQNGSTLTPPDVAIPHSIYPYPGPIALMIGGIYGGNDTCLNGKFVAGDFGGAAFAVNLQTEDVSFLRFQCASNPSHPCNATGFVIYDVAKDANGELYFSTAPRGVFKTVSLDRCNLKCSASTSTSSSNGAAVTSGTRVSSSNTFVVSVALTLFSLILSFF